MAGAALKEKVVYLQNDVFVHAPIPSSTSFDLIKGKFIIIENNDGTVIKWSPSGSLPNVEYEVHGKIEYGVITNPDQSDSCDCGSQNEDPLTISASVKQIKSIRRSDPRNWSYVMISLKDGSSWPALHFHSGGVPEMISSLQRYIWLTKSNGNNRLFVSQEKDDVMESALNQFELFSDYQGVSDGIHKMFNDRFFHTLNAFSKISNYVLGTVGTDLQERRPQTENGKSLNDSDEFELVSTDEPDVIGAAIDVHRGDELQPEEWCTYVNDDGVIENVSQLKDRIFRGGIHMDIKREAWKFILGYQKFESTYDERNAYKEKRREDYMRMKSQWESISEDQERRFSEFLQRKHLVEKDAHRTDRTVKYFQGENNENIQKLTNILMTYCMYNFDLGYVQGMSDLLSPIVQLIDDEVDSFWCFVGFMEMEELMFEISQDLMKSQLDTLGKLIQYIFPHFWSFLVEQEAGNLYICFRWILISFKREFELNDVMKLWEVLWTQTLSPHFKLFICLAILEQEKDKMMRKKYGFNEILKHINRLSGNIDLNYILSRAESICLQLQRKKDLPDHIKDLLYQPVNDVNVNECTDNQDPHETTTVMSDDSVVDVQASDHSVF